MNELAAFLALAAGMATAAVVCRGIDLGLGAEIVMAPIAGYLAYLSLSLGGPAWLSAVCFVGGYALAVIAARSGPPDHGTPELIDHESLHHVRGRGRE
jgi:hypothetical protein